MATEKELTGILFKNDKGENEKRPDYRGDIKIGGVVYTLAGWIRQSANGPYLSLVASPPINEEDIPF